MVYANWNTKAGLMRGSELSSLIFLDCFHLLHEELKRTPSYGQEFPEVEDGRPVNTLVLPPQQRILSALWYLATGDSYRSIAKK